jgi:hypothetical protein
MYIPIYPSQVGRFTVTDNMERGCRPAPIAKGDAQKQKKKTIFGNSQKVKYPEIKESNV